MRKCKICEKRIAVKEYCREAKCTEHCVCKTVEKEEYNLITVYDKENDMLFMHVSRKVKTDYTVELSPDFIVDMKITSRGDIPVGLAILNVKKYLK